MDGVEVWKNNCIFDLLYLTRRILCAIIMLKIISGAGRFNRFFLLSTTERTICFYCERTILKILVLEQDSRPIPSCVTPNVFKEEESYEESKN